MTERRDDELKSGFHFAIRFVILIWLVHIIQFFTGGALSYFGVYPRHVEGLKGIIFSPLIHGDWQHLISNSIPLLVLLTLIFGFYRRVAVWSFVLIYLLTGLAVWLFSRPVYHIGASGVVYGLVAFVFWTGVFRRNTRSVILALVVLVLYSGYFLGIVPGEEGISWESHLYGGIVGIIIAFLFHNRREPDEEPEEIQWEEEPERYFLDRDTFERKRKERDKDNNWWSNST